MPWNSTLNRLRDVLAELYPDVADARRVAASASLPLARVTLQGKAVNDWQAILDEAAKQDRVEGVIVAATAEYGSNSPLMAAVEAYRRWVASGRQDSDTDAEPSRDAQRPGISWFGAATTAQTTSDQGIGIECADIADFMCDVVVLKHAQGFYGADRAVANRIRTDYAQAIMLGPGQHLIIPSEGRIAARQALFIGMPPLYQIGYSDIRRFARQAMHILAGNMPSARHVAMTIHGPGFGLDETECFLAQLAGIIDAFRNEDVPPFLQRITIVEKVRRRATLLDQILRKHLPTASLSSHDQEGAVTPQSRIDAAGLQSNSKPHIFVAMPFSQDMDDTYYFGVQGPVNAAGYLCERVDLSAFTGDIIARIRSRIETASLVIADLTGANANVYLEVGYAWGVNRPTVLIAKKGEELKFDVKTQRCLLYTSIMDLAKKLEADLKALSHAK